MGKCPNFERKYTRPVSLGLTKRLGYTLEYIFPLNTWLVITGQWRIYIRVLVYSLSSGSLFLFIKFLFIKG